MIRKVFALCAGCLAWASATAQVFDNHAVIALREAGLGEATLLTKINSLPCAYDVSTDGLISLKKAGVTDPVIAAMVSRCIASSRAQGIDNGSMDPLVKHAPGIYLAQDWLADQRVVLLRPATGSGTRTTGNGSVLFPLKSMLTLPQPASQNHALSKRPTFYFYFDTADRNVSDFGVERSVAAQSPSEFSLVRFRIKGNAREIEVGRLSAYFSISLRKGVNAKDTTAFVATEVGDGIFKVSASDDMPPGEYAFIFSGESGRSRVYDFSVAAETGSSTVAAPK
ncbi:MULTISPECIES: hypothetical protein [Sphingomonas]|jgi:hypothetical protein|uniref:hypothetical protein n=1 Tax=Sphingomonas TaxID=13687 RepID=UPI001AE6B44B